MGKRLTFQEMLGFLRQNLESVPEHRTGQNTQYSIAEAGLGAFSVFYMQSPSLSVNRVETPAFQAGRFNTTMV